MYDDNWCTDGRPKYISSSHTHTYRYTLLFLYYFNISFHIDGIITALYYTGYHYYSGISSTSSTSHPLLILSVTNAIIHGKGLGNRTERKLSPPINKSSLDNDVHVHVNSNKFQIQLDQASLNFCFSQFLTTTFCRVKTECNRE